MFSGLLSYCYSGFEFALRVVVFFIYDAFPFILILFLGRKGIEMRSCFTTVSIIFV